VTYAIGRVPGGLLEERLRTWVRAHSVKRGVKTRLAEHLDRDPEWVSMYLKGIRDADFDTTVAMLKFFGVSGDAVLRDALPELPADDVEIRNLWRTLHPDARRVLKRHIVELGPLAQRATEEQSDQHSQPEQPETEHKTRGKRRGA
jgi:hypothetical protein